MTGEWFTQGMCVAVLDNQRLKKPGDGEVYLAGISTLVLNTHL